MIMTNDRGGGFTLLEVLLASVLSCALLLALWSLLSMHSRLFQTGQTRIEQSQLARTLLEQIADDLRSAIPPPPPGPPLTSALPMASASNVPTNASQPRQTSSMASAAPPLNGTTVTESTVRPATLRGSEDSLQVDVLQVSSSQLAVTPPDEMSESRGQKPRPRAPELRTIFYHFEQPRRGPRSDAHIQGGLTRRELDWASAHAPSSRLGLGRRLTRPTIGALGASDNGEPGRPTPSQPQGVAPDDPSTTKVPEVVQCKFRYFDGRRWSTQWDSAARGSLPLAVEVQIQVKTTDEIKTQHHAVVDLERDEQNPQAAREQGDRLVIYLPAAKPVEKSADDSSGMATFGGN